MSELGADAMRGVSWPSNGLSEVPFRLYTDPEQYRLEQERIFKGPAWSFLCLAAEIPNAGDYVATTIGETAVVVTRDAEGGINAFANRCAHRGNLLCIERQGNAKEIKCIYHGWTYDLGRQADRRRFRARGQAAGRDAARIPQGRPRSAAAAGRRIGRLGVRHVQRTARRTSKAISGRRSSAASAAS